MTTLGCNLCSSLNISGRWIDPINVVTSRVLKMTWLLEMEPKLTQTSFPALTWCNMLSHMPHSFIPHQRNVNILHTFFFNATLLARLPRLCSQVTLKDRTARVLHYFVNILADISFGKIMCWRLRKKVSQVSPSLGKWLAECFNGFFLLSVETMVFCYIPFTWGFVSLWDTAALTTMKIHVLNLNSCLMLLQ